jgi:hypothetical protein
MIAEGTGRAPIAIRNPVALLVFRDAVLAALCGAHQTPAARPSGALSRGRLPPPASRRRARESNAAAMTQNQGRFRAISGRFRAIRGGFRAISGSQPKERNRWQQSQH